MGALTKVADTVEKKLSGVDYKSVLKKTVVVPVKWIVIAGGVIALGVVIILASKRAEPYANYFLGSTPAHECDFMVDKKRK